jgi:hypothetical protein
MVTLVVVLLDEDAMGEEEVGDWGCIQSSADGRGRWATVDLR